MSDPKVQLEELLFTMSWEDPALDREAFGTQPGDRIATVASGGCNTLAFLLDDPSEVFAFDYNVTQVWTTELKRVAIRELDDAAVYELLGVKPSTRRAELMSQLEPHLDADAVAWWATQPWLLEKGLLGGGRYERFVGLFQRLLGLIQGRRRCEALFEPRDKAARRAFFDEQWNRWSWRLLFKAFFNKAVLSRRGLSPEYFTFDDGSASFAESFARRTEHALTELEVASNPFLSQYVLGRYVSEAAYPEYLKPDNLAVIRERVDRVKVVQGDVRDVFDPFDDGTFHAICLSNVFELMSEEQTAEVLPGIARVLAPGRRLTLRNLMIPRSVPQGMSDILVRDEALSADLRSRDRSFVYRAVDVYERPVEEP